MARNWKHFRKHRLVFPCNSNLTQCYRGLARWDRRGRVKFKTEVALRCNLFSICRSCYLIHLPLDSFDFFFFFFVSVSTLFHLIKCIVRFSFFFLSLSLLFVPFSSTEVCTAVIRMDEVIKSFFICSIISAALSTFPSFFFFLFFFF